ncbi:MAG: hypothetical protein IJX00_00285 [Clostridia bacterium]|nr:hypothetical protein [Clostridia bacterium]
MSFLYLFDAIEFDAAGEVSASKSVSLEQARSNYLYLVSKYNQMFLKEENQEVPAFFKEELGAVLVEVEKGGDFDKAEKKVLANCVVRVQKMASNAQSRRQFVAALNAQIVLDDKKIVDKIGVAENRLHKEYLFTKLAAQVFESVVIASAKEGAMADKKSKSAIFKDIIKYNSLIASASMVKSAEAGVQTSKSA